MVENERCQINWNNSFSSTRALKFNKRDIVLKNRENSVICVIDFSCPSKTDIATKGREKRDKYRDFIFDIGHQQPGFVKKIDSPHCWLTGRHYIDLQDAKSNCSGKPEDLRCAKGRSIALGSLLYFLEMRFRDELPAIRRRNVLNDALKSLMTSREFGRATPTQKKNKKKYKHNLGDGN